jgi:hypothetical protein
MKPAHGFYDAIIKDQKIFPSQMLFIDDLTENVKAEKYAGMQAIQFESTGQLEAELKKLGILKHIPFIQLVRLLDYTFTTPMPDRSVNVTFPLMIFVPSKTSFLISNAPSRSAQSTIGERWDAADIAHDVSVIQPIITFIPNERARVSIFCASRIPVHFINLILIP